MHHDAGGHNRHILATAAGDGLVQWHGIMALRHRPFHFIEQFVLENHHRIGVGYGGQQQALGIMRRCRLHNLQAGHMRQPGLKALAVLCRRPCAGTGGKAHHQRYRHRTAEHIAQLCRLIDDLFHRQCGKIGKLELENWSQTRQRRPDRHACPAQFGNRRIHDAIRAKTMHQIPRDLKGTAIDANILPHQNDTVILFHGYGHGLLNGLGIRQFARVRVHHSLKLWYRRRG